MTGILLSFAKQYFLLGNKQLMKMGPVPDFVKLFSKKKIYYLRKFLGLAKNGRGKSHNNVNSEDLLMIVSAKQYFSVPSNFCLDLRLYEIKDFLF